MIGILLLTHNHFGECLIENVVHVLGQRPPQLQAFGLIGCDCPYQAEPAVQALIRELDDGQGVIVLTDIYGASPSNLACRLLVPGRVEGISGVNLPMLLRLISSRHLPLAQAVAKVLACSRDSIIDLHSMHQLCVA